MALCTRRCHMVKKLALLGIVALIGAGVAGVMSASAKSSAGATATYLDHTVSSHDSDNGTPGFGPGDQFTSHDVLKQNGNKVGTLDSYCEVTNLVGHSAFI